MAMITRQTLMQHGVSVVRGGQTVRVRLGSGDAGHGKLLSFPISLRRPAPGNSPADEPEQRLDAAAIRAGRSDCHAGVLPYRSPALRASLASRRSGSHETRSWRAGGLSLPCMSRIDKRLAGQRTRLAASTRRGGE